MPVVFYQVSKAFEGKQVLRSLSLELPDRGVICFFGPSGCGKTTLFRLIAGLSTPDSGSITGLEGKRISYVFQENRLLPWLNAEQNIRAVQPKDAALSPLHYLALMGLSDAQRQYPSQLSGGMNRRLAIARALAAPFDLLLLDEPFTGLDEDTKQQVCAAIFPTNRDKLILLTTHDRSDAESLSDRLVVVQGPPLQITEEKELHHF